MNRSERASQIEKFAAPFRAIAELDGGVAFIADCRSGALLYISASVESLIGYTDAEFIAGFGAAGSAVAGLCAVMAEGLAGASRAGSAAIDFAEGGANQSADRATAANSAAPGPLQRETVQPHRDGRLVPLAVTTTLVGDADGAPAWLAGSLRDLSARDAQAAAQRRFASMLNHDFRTPLSTIDGAIQRLESGAANADEPTRTRYRKIGAAVDRLIEMLDTYLSPDRLDDIGQAARADSISPATLLAEGAEQARAAGRSVQIDTGDLPALIRCEPAGLRMALRVLVDNALAYSPAGSAVSLAGRRADAGIVLQVADAGPGVPEAECDVIFGKQVRGSNAAGVPGSGLGLYMARAVVDVHGGKLSMRNLPGGGAEFSLWLPAQGGAGKTVAVTSSNSDNSVSQ